MRLHRLATPHLADPAFDADREAVDRARPRRRARGDRLHRRIARRGAARARALAAAHPRLLLSTAGVHPHDAAEFDPARRSSPRIRDAARCAAPSRSASAVSTITTTIRRAISSARLRRAARARARAATARSSCTRARPKTTRAHGRSKRHAPASSACCTATPAARALAEAALDGGWYVSFSGIVTFKKWTDDDAAAPRSRRPAARRSDSPYLAPVPHRGKRNEPAWVAHTSSGWPRCAACRRMP